MEVLSFCFVGDPRSYPTGCTALFVWWGHPSSSVNGCPPFLIECMSGGHASWFHGYYIAQLNSGIPPVSQVFFFVLMVVSFHRSDWHFAFLTCDWSPPFFWTWELSPLLSRLGLACIRVFWLEGCTRYRSTFGIPLVINCCGAFFWTIYGFEKKLVLDRLITRGFKKGPKRRRIELVEIRDLNL